MRTLILASALLLPLTAANAGQCPELTERGRFAELNVAQVKAGQARVPFLKDDCDDTKPGACHSKAFVMPGDVVLVGQVFDVSACAVFVDGKGRTTAGLLPNDRLEVPTPRPKADRSALVGTWSRVEAEIVVKPKGRDGMLTFAGAATYGALDKNRVARGAVNLGEFSFDVKPSANSVDIALGTSGAVARNAKSVDDTDCAVAMIGLGPYLVAEDNRNCGGVNVSFTGIYRQKR